MSVHAISAVLKHSKARLGDRLVMLVLADHADADGGNSFPSLELIAEEALMSTRQVRRALQKLEGTDEKPGEICADGATATGVTIWQLQLPGLPNCHEVVTNRASAPIKEPSLNHQSSNSLFSEEHVEKKNAGSSSELSSEAQRVFDHWATVMPFKRRPRFTDDRRRKVEARLREGYTAADCIAAINGIASSDWHMGRSPDSGGKLNNDLELICRTGGKLERYAEMAPEAAPDKTAEEILTERSTYHPEVEVPDMREAGEYPFDPASDEILKAAGIEA